MPRKRIANLPLPLFLAAALSTIGASPAAAQISNCASILAGVGNAAAPLTWEALKTALATAVSAENSGLKNQMWATIVDRDGTVCAVAFSGANRGAQWPGSRIISAQKAYAANAFSLDASSANGAAPGQPNGLALSTANLYSAVQPGGSLWGLEGSSLMNPAVAYTGISSSFGQINDPMVGQKAGGLITFGGGLALYNSNHVIVGGVGVSGDTSCTDHDVAWRLRHALALDHMAAGGNTTAVPGPASLFAKDPSHPDNIIYDITAGVSASGFGHPTCLNVGDASALPAVVP
jgi:uncharacterized protein GlcG (DUF336 family)